MSVIREQLENVMLFELGNRVLFASTVMDGLGTNDVAPFGPAGQEVQSLGEEVLRRVGIELVEEEAYEREAAMA